MARNRLISLAQESLAKAKKGDKGELLKLANNLIICPQIYIGIKEEVIQLLFKEANERKNTIAANLLKDISPAKHSELTDSSDASTFVKAKNGDRQSLLSLASKIANVRGYKAEQGMNDAVCELLFERAKAQDSRAATLLFTLRPSMHRELEDSPEPDSPDSSLSFTVTPLSSEPTDEERDVLAKVLAKRNVEEIEDDKSYKSPPVEKGHTERTASPSRKSTRRLNLSFQPPPAPPEAKKPEENPEKKANSHRRSFSLNQ